MTDKRIDIEVIDKVAPTAETKIRGIATVARDANKALLQLEESLNLIGKSSGRDLVSALNNTALAETKALLAQQKLATEIERTNLVSLRSAALLDKQTAALDRLKNKSDSLNLSSALDKQFGINNTSKSAKSSFNTLDSVNSSYTKAIAAQAQSDYNNILGVNAAISKSARDSASVFAEEARSASVAAAELDSYRTKAEALKAALDPLGAAQKAHAARIAEADELLKRNLITQNEHQKVVINSSNALNQQTRAINIVGNSASLSAFQLQNLTYQINDIITGLYSGQKPLTVFVQQGLQLQQIFGNAGLTGALKTTVSYLSSFITVGRLAFAGLAAGAFAASSAFSNYVSRQKEVENVLRGFGAYSGLITKDIENIALSAKSSAKISVASAESMAAAFVAAGNANTENLTKAISISRDLSATLGISIEQGTKVLSGIFNDPIKGFRELNNQLRFTDESGIKVIENLVLQGKQQEAISLGIDKLKKSTISADDASTVFGRTWENIKNSISDASNALGSAIDKGIYGPNQRFNKTDNDAYFNKLSADAALVSGKFTTYNSVISTSKAQTELLAKAISETEIRLNAATDAGTVEALTKQYEDLSKAKRILDTISASLEKYGDVEQRLQATGSIDIALITARTAAQRADLTAQKERISLAGQNVSAIEVEIKARQAADAILVASKKAHDDEIYALDRENKLIGIIGLEREIANELLQREISARASGNAYSAQELQILKERLIVKQYGNLQDQATNAIYDESVNKIAGFRRELTATNIAYQQGWINTENYAIRLNKVSLAVSDLRLKLGNGNLTDATNVALGKLVSNYEGVLPGLSNSFGDFFKNVNDGFADSIGRAIVMSENLSDAIHNVAQNALAGLISALIKLGIQYAINATLGQSIAVTATAASAVQASTLAAAWAPAASLASLATSGANLPGALTALSTADAFAIALSIAKPFVTGGNVYGDGTSTSDSILAKLSNGEFVVNAKSASENRPLLQAINSGKRVIPTVSDNKSSGIKVSVVNNTPANISVEQISETEVRIIAEQVANNIVNKRAPSVVAASISNPNSPVSRALSNNTDASRRR